MDFSRTNAERCVKKAVRRVQAKSGVRQKSQHIVQGAYICQIHVLQFVFILFLSLIHSTVQIFSFLNIVAMEHAIATKH